MRKDGLNGVSGADGGLETRDPNQCRWGLRCDPSRGDEDLGIEGSGSDSEVGIAGLELLVSELGPGLGPGRQSGAFGVLGK